VPEATSAPSTAEVQRTDVRRFACPGCGATLLFAAGIDKMKCDYCGHEQAIPADTSSPAQHGPVEHQLSELLNSQAARGWGRETVTFQCKQCGASTTLPEGQTTGRCAFCDCDIVVPKPANPDLIRPETLIPFKISKQVAVDTFKQWLSSLWFVPSNLSRMASLAEIHGMYMPFWTFDGVASSRWSAMSGYDYTETEYYTDNDGNQCTREVTRTRWEPSSGEHECFYKDVLVCASRGLPPDFAKRLEPCNTVDHLQPYQAEYLSGWGAEEYAVQPQEAWQRGQVDMQHREYMACDQQVPGDRHSNLNVATRLDQVTWKHCLLPVWIAAYRYNGKTYRFLVNGESGKASGEAPLSWVKITLLVLAIVAIAYLVYQQFFANQPPPQRYHRYNSRVEIRRTVQVARVPITAAVLARSA
jgi:DNA-directed RNA polymerase subunit M/transcription elongation factor TFIIS